MDEQREEAIDRQVTAYLTLIGFMPPDGKEMVAIWDKLPLAQQEAIKRCVGADLIFASFTPDGRVWCKLTATGQQVQNDPVAILATIAVHDPQDLDLVPADSHKLWDLMYQWQMARNLSSINAAQVRRFRASLKHPAEYQDDEFIREQADSALRLSVEFAERALATRWQIVTHAEAMAGSLGAECPRSLRQFYVLLRPHGDEDAALKIWPEVQVDLDAVYAAKGVVVQPFTSVAPSKALHTSPADSPKPAEGKEAADSGNEFTSAPEGGRSSTEPAAASEDMRAKYHDPDNYWRNVWLYERRKSGKKNREILDELKIEKGQEFSHLETDNALRTAIESIAIHHNWLMLQGKAGRPKSTPQCGE